MLGIEPRALLYVLNKHSLTKLYPQLVFNTKQSSINSEWVSAAGKGTCTKPYLDSVPSIHHGGRKGMTL